MNYSIVYKLVILFRIDNTLNDLLFCKHITQRFEMIENRLQFFQIKLS